MVRIGADVLPDFTPPGVPSPAARPTLSGPAGVKTLRVPAPPIP